MNHYPLSDWYKSGKAGDMGKEEASGKFMLSRLLHGEFSSGEEAERALRENGIYLPHGHYLVLVFRFDDYKDLSGQREPFERYLLKCGMLSLSIGIFRPHFACEGVESGSDHIAVILNSAAFPEEEAAKAKKKCGEFLKNVREQLNVSISAGIGTVGENCSGIRSSYENALTASEYRLVFGQQSVIQYRDIEGRETEENFRQDNHTDYPYELEHQLAASLKQCHPEHALTLLDQFAAYIRNGSVRNIRSSLLRLCSALMKAAAHHNVEADPIRISFADLTDRMLSLDTLEQIKSYLMQNLLLRLMRENPADRRKKEDLLCNAVEYIHSNYGGPDLTIELLAQHINYSASHMRKLFRDAFNCSPTEYLFSYRLEMAKKMLAETEETARAISEKVGYTNTKYFYNIFKKSTGLTTYEYREQLRTKGPLR